MKKMRKLIAVVLAVTVAMTMGIATSGMAFAAVGDYQITVENTNDAMSINGKTYSAYKVFDLTLGQEDTTKNPPTYGAYAYSIKSSDWAFSTLTKDATTNAETGVITTTYGIVLTPSAADPTTYSVDGELMDSAKARDFADALKPVLPSTADGQGVGGEQEKAVIDLGAAGWYAVYGTVKPTDPKQTEEVVAAVGLTTTDKKVTVNPKASVPTLDKKITKVEEGSTEVANALLDTNGKAAVAKVGSKVSYKLTSNVPDLTGYDDYTFTFNDAITAGLDYVTDSFVLKIGDSTVDIAPTFASGNKSFALNIPYENLSAEGVKAGDSITLTYACTVNSNAVSYDYDNNTASLEYSNNPYDDTTNHTPDKKTYVININLDIDKVDGSNSATKLKGAEFKLYRMNGTAKEYYKWDNNKVTWVAEANAQVLKTVEGGKLEEQVKGLDKGEYFLVETKAPTGYNLMKDPVKVTLTPTESADGNTVTYAAQNATVTNGVVDLTENQTSNQPLATATIQNNSGTELPSTGGIGTTIFYILGALLVVGCGIILIARRRMTAK